MIGIDEVGRGCIAGDVYACALFFDEGVNFDFAIKDSKQFSSTKREVIYNHIISRSDIKYAIGIATIQEIQDVNILNATMLAMERAYNQLGIFDKKVLIDGNKKPAGIVNAECVVNGDATIPHISLASIMAKVARDKVMIEYDKIFPQYEFAKHKGYGTKKHFDLIKQYGLCEIHRKEWCIK